jgi:glycosyltransferase involved in cell wall biosynthesis
VGLDANVTLFPNLVDLHRIETLGRGPPTVRFPERGPNVVYFGRLSAQKNVGFLIKSFASLRRDVDAHRGSLAKGISAQRWSRSRTRLGSHTTSPSLAFRKIHIHCSSRQTSLR